MIVRLPTVLEAYADGSREVDASGGTVEELLLDLDRQYPGIRFRMVNEQDQLRPHMRVFVNRNAIRDLNIKISENDEVVILQALSGG